MAISMNLKDAAFIVCRKNSKLPLVPKGQDWNNHIIDYDEANLALNKGFNIGLVGGLNGYLLVDCDSPKLKDVFYNLMQRTFEEKSISGNVHLIFKADGFMPEQADNCDFNEGKVHLGELRAHRRYIVIAPSKARDPKKGINDTRPYIVLNDVPPISISREDIRKIRESLKGVANSNLQTPTAHVTDESRSGREFAELCKLIKQGKPKEEVWTQMQAFAKWVESSEQYRELSYKKALEANKNSFALSSYDSQFQELPQNAEPFELRDINYFRNLKVSKKYIVKDFIRPQTLIMFASPPKNAKSIVSNHLALSVANGIDFVGLKTHKTPTLIIDCENPDSDIKYRILGLKEGLNLRQVKNIYFLSRSEQVDIFSPHFLNRVKKTVEKYNIKLIILDTLRRMSPDLKENESDDVSRFYRLFFAPLRDEFGVAIIFLHHMDKKGKNYRGSSDLQAMVDAEYHILKIKDSEKAINVLIKKEVSRSDLLDQLFVEYRFLEKSIEPLEIAGQEPPQRDEYKVLYKEVLNFFENCGKGIQTKRGGINAYLDSKGFDSKKKRGSVTRILEFLQSTGKIESDIRGKYYLI